MRKHIKWIGVALAGLAISIPVAACGADSSTEATAAEGSTTTTEEVAGVDETADAVAEGTEAVPFSVIEAKLDARGSRIATQNSNGRFTDSLVDSEAVEIGEGEAMWTGTWKVQSNLYPTIKNVRSHVYRVTFDPNGHIDTIKDWDGSGSGAGAAA